MTLLETQELSKSFGALKAVNKVSLSIERGVIEALIGPNGAGKTTLINLLTKHLTPDSGRVLFKGEDISKLPPHLICQRGLGRSFQRVSIFSRLTVFQNIQVAIVSQQKRGFTFFSPVTKMFKGQIFEILDKVGLADQANLLSANLAHGDQRRLEIALALATEPEMMVLDEPAAGMSIEERASLVGLLRSMVTRDGVTVLFTEHDMDVVFSTAERITVMHEGRILTAGKPEDVKMNEEVQRVYFGEVEHA
jgi:branched-chain amino acid transport system ATP-binding protein